MRKMVRDIIGEVREAGGSDVRVSEGGNHTRVHFMTPRGSHACMLIHRGTNVSKRYTGMLRSQMRRKMRDAADSVERNLHGFDSEASAR
jgi:hypothetical protein